MPRRIVILPDAVADQIAAGEVVERPASVVKELVENALDAGAHHVRVELEQGGKTLIQVSDDGSGMGREDAVLALDRHATSKLRSAADLVGVATFGFRGEALPAIASVSRFTLSTCEGEGEGTELSVAGGRLDRVADAVRQRGTTVTVRGLFFNTPARRKFLRSVASETRAAHDALATLALAHPDVGFELHVDGTCRLAVPTGESPDERLASVWGRDLAGTLVPVNYAAGAFRVAGFVQRPGDAQPSGRRTQLFVNGRPFKDPFLVRAAEAGYRSAIAPGDRPSVAAAPVGSWRAAPVGPGSGRMEPLEASELFAPVTTQDPIGIAEESTGSSQVAPLQMFDTYIVYEAPDAVVIVDQHSAHERVLYESVMAQLTGADAPAQRLLLPITLELTDEELDAVETHAHELRRVGFEAEPFGGQSVVLHTVPAPHPRFDAAACFRELIADLARGRFGGWANRLERFAATYACRAAIKAGQRLDQREIRELLLRLFATDLPPHDVHGRATIVQLPREELERRFGRR
jgi:DNA mismatch repair protein MutL